MFGESQPARKFLLCKQKRLHILKQDLAFPQTHPDSVGKHLCVPAPTPDGMSHVVRHARNARSVRVGVAVKPRRKVQQILGPSNGFCCSGESSIFGLAKLL